MTFASLDHSYFAMSIAIAIQTKKMQVGTLKLLVKEHNSEAKR